MSEALIDQAQTVAEALDDLRERLMFADLPDEVIACWREVAEHAWNAVAVLDEAVA